MRIASSCLKLSIHFSSTSGKRWTRWPQLLSHTIFFLPSPRRLNSQFMSLNSKWRKLDRTGSDFLFLFEWRPRRFPANFRRFRQKLQFFKSRSLKWPDTPRRDIPETKSNIKTKNNLIFWNLITNLVTFLEFSIFIEFIKYSNVRQSGVLLVAILDKSPILYIVMNNYLI